MILWSTHGLPNPHTYTHTHTCRCTDTRTPTCTQVKPGIDITPQLLHSTSDLQAAMIIVSGVWGTYLAPYVLHSSCHEYTI
mmetsp:Transcript_150171/g.262370  ORF Transcript_150171/g.262370 Transcript_150171/m.262370 type:complete len:81 (-) Transcript_150171:2650-2892(-)